MSRRFVRQMESRFPKCWICPGFLKVVFWGLIFFGMGSVTGIGTPQYAGTPSLESSLNVSRLPAMFSGYYLKALDDHPPFHHRQGNDSDECHPGGFASGKSPVIACHHTQTILSIQDHCFLPLRGEMLIKPFLSLPAPILTVNPLPVYLKVPIKPPDFTL
ncbi:MAG: hypothetical protein ACYC9S_10865 [Leptospirales bacterium]